MIEYIPLTMLLMVVNVINVIKKTLNSKLRAKLARSTTRKPRKSREFFPRFLNPSFRFWL